MRLQQGGAAAAVANLPLHIIRTPGKSRGTRIYNRIYKPLETSAVGFIMGLVILFKIRVWMDGRKGGEI